MRRLPIVLLLVVLAAAAFRPERRETKGRLPARPAVAAAPAPSAAHVPAASLPMGEPERWGLAAWLDRLRASPSAAVRLAAVRALSLDLAPLTVEALMVSAEGDIDPEVRAAARAALPPEPPRPLASRRALFGPRR